MRPQANSLGREGGPIPSSLEGRERCGWSRYRPRPQAPAALQAARPWCLFDPGNRPEASSLGWGLPARWAGWGSWPVHVPQRGVASLANEDRVRSADPDLLLEWGERVLNARSLQEVFRDW